MRALWWPQRRSVLNALVRASKAPRFRPRRAFCQADGSQLSRLPRVLSLLLVLLRQSLHAGLREALLQCSGAKWGRLRLESDERALQCVCEQAAQSYWPPAHLLYARLPLPWT
eukprot:2732409-Prymnesium_polylepis.2